ALMADVWAHPENAEKDAAAIKEIAAASVEPGERWALYIRAAEAEEVVLERIVRRETPAGLTREQLLASLRAHRNGERPVELRQRAALQVAAPLPGDSLEAL